MKTIFHAQISIISNLLVISSSFLVISTTTTTTTTYAHPSHHQSSNNTTNETTPRPSGASQLAQPSAAPSNNNYSATTLKSSTIPAVSTTSTLGCSLIGSILLRAANLNLLNEDRQRHYATFGTSNINDDDDPDEPYSSDSPQGQLTVPTDSGEDPLESTTTTTTLPETTQDNPHDGSSQQQAPPAATLTITSSKTSLDPEGELAVDSNNVSAIITLPMTFSGTPISRPPSPMSCEQAYTQCALRKACAPALKAYHDHCHELISNQTDDCSPKCLDAMIGLRSSEEGDDLANCECGQSRSDPYCLASKQRSLLCKSQVDHAIDPKTVVSCSTASWICMADQSCAPALGFYYRNCRSLLSQRHCSARCNNSLSVLNRQPKAQKLMSCQCDGSEEFPCLKLKTYTQRLCLNQRPESSEESPTEGEEREQEEESSNLTNNPENFGLGAPLSSTEQEQEQDEDDADDSSSSSGKDAASHQLNSANYNGIQLVEDNWIPLISGRYFTNLHQQRQQQLAGTQQHKLQRQGPKETQNKQQQQQQQQMRKAQKSIRQQRARSTTNATHHEGKRSRFGRIFMFAASTSSSSSSAYSIHHPWWWQLLAPALLVAIAMIRLAVNVY